MIYKKICVLGASAVGKTSLVRRFVHGIFSDVYRTTIGVQIESKRMAIGEEELELIIWDLEGEDAFAQLQMPYLRGAAGYLVVADGTRAATLDAALRLDASVRSGAGELPRVILLNKLDLFDDWEISDRDVAHLAQAGFRIERSSAKTGAGVADSFAHMARALLPAHFEAGGAFV